MLIYVEEVVAEVEGLLAYAELVLKKFDDGRPAAEILLDVDVLQNRLATLTSLLPEGVHIGDWTRKIYFMRLYLKKV